MAERRRSRNDELADAIDRLRLATIEREDAIPGSQAHDDALANEELLNGFVLELVRQKNLRALGTGTPSPSRVRARPRTNGVA